MPLFIFVLVRFKHQNHNARFIQFILIEMPSPRLHFRVFGEVSWKIIIPCIFLKISLQSKIVCMCVCIRHWYLLPLCLSPPPPSPHPSPTKWWRESRADFPGGIQGPGCLLSCVLWHCSFLMGLAAHCMSPRNNSHILSDLLNQNPHFPISRWFMCMWRIALWFRDGLSPVFFLQPVRGGKEEVEGMQICFKGWAGPHPHHFPSELTCH